MRRFGRLFGWGLGCVAVCSAGGYPDPQSGNTVRALADPGYYRMKRATVIDQRSFERPMLALSLLVPVDWQFQGQVEYSKTMGCHADMVQVVFRAQSPDGRLGLELFPAHHWQWSADPGTVQLLRSGAQQSAQFGRKECDIAPPSPAADYLQRQVIPGARPGARVVGVEPLPEFTQKLNANAREQEQLAARSGLRLQLRLDAARVRLEYRQNGLEMEEWIAGICFTLGMPAPSFNLRTGHMGQTVSYQCGAYMIFGLRAPRGELAARERFFNMILATVQPDAAWEGRIQQVISSMAATDSRAAKTRSDIIARNGRETRDIINKGYQERSRRTDSAIAQFDQYIRGVETYRNPATGETFQLSNQYGNAWISGSNEYVLTDQAGFNPNTALRGNWTRLQPVKP